ncbi:MAG: hypothetical protein HC906_03795 [Bacteroidales bacterium]|nr:hypothetical protein [Bacteroidales bacterium]
MMQEKKEIGHLISDIVEKPISNKPFVLAVCGGTSTCKSSYIVPFINENLMQKKVTVLNQDDFQKD